MSILAWGILLTLAGAFFFFAGLTSGTGGNGGRFEWLIPVSVCIFPAGLLLTLAGFSIELSTLFN